MERYQVQEVRLPGLPAEPAAEAARGHGHAGEEEAREDGVCGEGVAGGAGVAEDEGASFGVGLVREDR